MVKNPCQPTIGQYHCFLLFPKSWSITFTARSCYIYKLRTQLVINSGASVQKNPQSMHFSQLQMAGSNHLRQELTLELFFSTSLRPLTQCLIGHCWKNFYGLNKYLIKWVASYLTGRKQQVVVNGSCSNFLPIISAVPQGSVLGPLLFIICINEVAQLPLTADSKLAMYADNILLYRPVRSTADLSQRSLSCELQYKLSVL